MMSHFHSSYKDLHDCTKEDTLVLEVRNNGREWQLHNTIVTMGDTPGGYIVYVYKEGEVEEEEGREVGLKEVKEGYNTITIMIPSVEALYNWFNLIYHKAPRFGTKRDHNPDDCC